ncbi:MAG TPA: hypothetical protein H9809_10730 [Candidatus Blautia pullicola]|jgi:hypothetical protein|uniref:TFIIB-type domain-containing protein n=1 Tax=Candidatus Blautia pullicola TaxID=2838498 RepID=A0A9D2FTS7_9FIRM|nr:hypothetical protein [Candidatus Blautia pullicola]
MSMFADCQDVRNMKTIVEIDCLKCHEKDGIEVFLKDGLTVGDSICDFCGYVIPEGSRLEDSAESPGR